MAAWWLVLVTALIAHGCDESSRSANQGAENPGAVSRAELGADWPLTVDRGVLSCDGPGVVFTTPDGSEYAVNGTAKGAGYADIEPIWREDPAYDLPDDGPPLRVDISPLIERGLELCE
ncbi:MAG TPA: DUF2511 domain-containing protein [Thermoleophilaceae bacterium]|nr:DUF2511 domain-containing protein [Thermoleophilaceae bacterium]